MQGSVEVKSDVGLVNKDVAVCSKFDVEALSVEFNDYIA